MEGLFYADLGIEEVFNTLTDNQLPYKDVRPEIVFDLNHKEGKTGSIIQYTFTEKDEEADLTARYHDLLISLTESDVLADQPCKISLQMEKFLKEKYDGCDFDEITEKLNGPSAIYNFKLYRLKLNKIVTFWREIFAVEDNRLIFKEVRIYKSFDDDATECKIFVRPAFHQRELLTKLIYPLFVNEPNPKDIAELDDGKEHFVFVPNVINKIKYSEMSLRKLLQQNKVKFTCLCPAIKVDENHLVGINGYCIGRKFFGEINDLIARLSEVLGLKPGEILKNTEDSDINFTLFHKTREQTAQQFLKLLENFSKPFSVVEEIVIMSFGDVTVVEMKIKTNSPTPLKDVQFLTEEIFSEATFQD